MHSSPKDFKKKKVITPIKKKETKEKLFYIKYKKNLFKKIKIKTIYII